MKDSGCKPLVSIIVLAYNHLNYTKLCIESLYKYTSHIDFELITVNNGSSDRTGEYLDSLDHKKKISFQQNVGGDKAFNEALKLVEGEYTLFVSNDLILTHNWLDNLLICIESDEWTGMVVPVCNASSYGQQIALEYRNLEEMQENAARFNKVNPCKWEERIRLITYSHLIRTELVKRLGGADEKYSPGGFDDDDLSFRVRRSGYRLILAGDTFIFHFGSVTMRDEYAKSNLLNRNRTIFLNKFGVDAWTDTVIDEEILSFIDYNRVKDIKILGVGSSCGGTVLQIKNRFRQRGITDVKLFYLAGNEKYLVDLRTVCDFAACCKYEDIPSIFGDVKFDYIIMENGLEEYDTGNSMLMSIKDVLREDGQIIFHIPNHIYYIDFIRRLNTLDITDINTLVNIRSRLANFTSQLTDCGFGRITPYSFKYLIPEVHRSIIEKLKAILPSDDKSLLEENLQIKRFIFDIRGKTKLKSALLYPGYDFWLNNRIFENSGIGDFLGTGQDKNAVAILKEEFAGWGYSLVTIDKGSIEDADYILFFDVPKKWRLPHSEETDPRICKGKMYLDECIKKKTQAKMVLILLEPPFFMPDNYDRDNHEPFDIIFTYDNNLIDNKKYFRFFISQPSDVKNPYNTEFEKKKLCTLISVNKYSKVPGELYSDRLKAIEYFEKNHSGCFDLYGRGWADCGLKTYKGPVDKKLEVLSQYRFSICFENGILGGYITEKIFDCFFSGCVPVYYGAPDIAEHIPDNTFIDFRNFADYGELYDFISNMSEERYNKYLYCIDNFLHSDRFKKFTHRYFANHLMQTLEGMQNTGTLKPHTETDEDDAPGVSVITCTNRERYMENVFANYDRQKFKRKELIIIINNTEMHPEEWLEKAGRYENVRLYHVDGHISLGHCLNIGASKASYGFVAKFDDDDYYAPNYLEDCMNAFKYSNADVIGQLTAYIYMEEIKTLTVMFPGMENCYTNRLHGATLVIKKEVFDKVRFGNYSSGEDTDFVLKCVNSGFKVYSKDRFNFVCIRHMSINDHVWIMSDETCLASTKFIAETEDYKTYITV